MRPVILLWNTTTIFIQVCRGAFSSKTGGRKSTPELGQRKYKISKEKLQVQFLFISKHYFLLSYRICGHEIEESFTVNILIMNLYPKSLLVLTQSTTIRNLNYFSPFKVKVQDLEAPYFLTFFLVMFNCYTKEHHSGNVQLPKVWLIFRS